MAVMATSADDNLPRAITFWGKLWQGLVEILKLISLWYVFNHKTWKERPCIRVRILLCLAFLWAYLWIPTTFIMYQFWSFIFLFPYFCALVAVLVFLAVFLAHGRKRPSLNLAFTIAAVILFWFALINLPIFLFSQPIQPVYMSVWGLIWIGVTAVTMLFLPVWMIAIRPNEIYFASDPQVEPDGYRLISRPRPVIEPNVYRALVACPDITREELDRFIDFNGPAYMRQPLWQKISDSDNVSRRMLEKLFHQIDHPAHAVSAALWVSAIDRVWLLWDISEVVWCSIDVRQLITKDGHPVDMQLQFGFVFDPKMIQRPETRLNLGQVESREALKKQLLVKIETVSTGIAQLYFIDLSLRAALTAGSVKDFGEMFVEKMDWARIDGITIQPGSVQCMPILHKDILEAEVQMLASRARAIDETARLQALIDKVLMQGVPPELLAGLLYLDQPARGSNATTQGQPPGGDMVTLPDVGTRLAARYLAQHAEDPAYYLDSGDDAQDADDDVPHQGGYTSNIGRRKPPE